MVRRRDAGPSRPSVQQGIAAAMGTTSFTQIKVSELAKYVGTDLSIPGSFWDNCPEADVDTLYPIKVVQYDVRHKFDGIGARCAAVRVEVQGSAAAFVENGNIWMATDVFSRHMSAENERQAAAEALEASQKIATGSLVEGEDEGECPELETVLATPPADICGGGSRGGKFFTHFAPPVLLRTVKRKARRKSGEYIDIEVRILVRNLVTLLSLRHPL